MALNTNDLTFQRDVLEAEVPVLVDFWAPWCGPCRALGPVIDTLGEKTDGKVKIFKLNVDENPLIAGKYGISGIPTVIVFHKGNVVQEFIGVQPEQVYLNTVSTL
jgi:thioredoxin 1